MNPLRGAVRLRINEEETFVRFTLGALAAFEAERKTSLPQFISSVDAGQPQTQDIVALLYAGLKAGGWEGDLDTLLSAEIDGGFVAALEAVNKGLRLAFNPLGQDE